MAAAAHVGDFEQETGDGENGPVDGNGEGSGVGQAGVAR